ncbi:hypothetical protein D3C76_689770 [compost metagenome]
MGCRPGHCLHPWQCRQPPHLWLVVSRAVAIERRPLLCTSSTALPRGLATSQPAASVICLGDQPRSAQTHGRQPRLAGAKPGTTGVFLWRCLAGANGLRVARPAAATAHRDPRQLGNRRHRLASGRRPLATLRRCAPGPERRGRLVHRVTVLACRPHRANRRCRRIYQRRALSLAGQARPYRQARGKAHLIADAGTGAGRTCLGR